MYYICFTTFDWLIFQLLSTCPSLFAHSVQEELEEWKLLPIPDGVFIINYAPRWLVSLTRLMSFTSVDSWRCVSSTTFLMNAAMSFSMLYFSRACVAHSTASCCMSSDMSAFFITAFLSDMVALGNQNTAED